MDDRNAQVGWTEAQWNRVREEVLRSWQRVRVAGSFLPAYGRLPPSTQVVPSEVIRADGATVDDQATALVSEILLTLSLSRQQVREEDLSSALLQFRRRATQLAQLEDWFIFNGYYPRGGPRAGEQPESISTDASAPAAGPSSSRGVANTEAVTSTRQVVLTARQMETRRVATPYVPESNIRNPDGRPVLKRGEEPVAGRHWEEQKESLLKRNPGALGLIEGAGDAQDSRDHATPAESSRYPLTSAGLMDAIVAAKSKLEENGYPAPYVCVFGRGPFEAAHRPTTSLAFPRDRLEPLIGREIVHASAIDVMPKTLLKGLSDAERTEFLTSVPRDWRNRALLLSLAGESVDLAIAAEATPEFLHVDAEGRYLFSVFERFALRIKDRKAIVAISFEEPDRPVAEDQPATAAEIAAAIGSAIEAAIGKFAAPAAQGEGGAQREGSSPAGT